MSWKDHAYNWFLESPPGDLFMRRVKDCAWQFLNGVRVLRAPGISTVCLDLGWDWDASVDQSKNQFDFQEAYANVCNMHQRQCWVGSGARDVSTRIELQPVFQGTSSPH